MTTYSFGDILLVPFPFTDQTSTKKRPTAVISSNNYNSQKPDLIIIAITSQFNSPINFGEMTWLGFFKCRVVQTFYNQACYNHDREEFDN